MLKGLLLAIGLAVAAPNLDDAQKVGVVEMQCMDGSPIEAHVYADQSFVFARGEKRVVYFNKSTLTFYVYGEQRYYTPEEILPKYPTPCDVPVTEGV